MNNLKEVINHKINCWGPSSSDVFSKVSNSSFYGDLFVISDTVSKNTTHLISFLRYNRHDEYGQYVSQLFKSVAIPSIPRKYTHYPVVSNTTGDM